MLKQKARAVARGRNHTKTITHLWRCGCRDKIYLGNYILLYSKSSFGNFYFCTFINNWRIFIIFIHSNVKLFDKEDDVKSKEDSDEESKETKEEITDPETGKKIKKVKHTGPRGGHYYINDNGEHIYPEEWNESIKNMKSVKSYITESKMVSLIEYLKKMVG